MITFHERLKNVRLERGLSQEKFGKVGGVGKQAQIKYEKGERFPDAAYLMALNNAGYDVPYIITGNQSEPSNESNVIAMSHLSEALEIVNEFDSFWMDMDMRREAALPLFVAQYNAGEKGIRKVPGIDIISESELFSWLNISPETPANNAEDPSKFALIPVLEVEASAGHGAIVGYEETSFMVTFNRDWLRREVGVAPQHLRLIRARGDSMNSGKGLGSDIYDDDILLVDTSVERIESDAAYIIQFDGCLVVKRMQKMFDGSVSIISSNPEYATQIVSVEQTPDIRIAGKVVYMIAGRRV